MSDSLIDELWEQGIDGREEIKRLFQEQETTNRRLMRENISLKTAMGSLEAQISGIKSFLVKKCDSASEFCLSHMDVVTYSVHP